MGGMFSQIPGRIKRHTLEELPHSWLQNRHLQSILCKQWTCHGCIRLPKSHDQSTVTSINIDQSCSHGYIVLHSWSRKSSYHHPNNQCMVDLLTFTSKMTYIVMWVTMECLGHVSMNIHEVQARRVPSCWRIRPWESSWGPPGGSRLLILVTGARFVHLSIKHLLNQYQLTNLTELGTRLGEHHVAASTPMKFQEGNLL